MKTLLQTLFFFLLVTQICFAQWVQTSYPAGGQITSIISKENNLFVCNNFQGVHLSTDNGSNWIPVINGLSNMNVHDLLVKENFTFAGTYNGGVFMSSNNGSNWAAANNGLINLKVYSLTESSPNIIAGTEGGGVFLSSDNGMNWSFSGLSGETIWDLCSDNNNILAAAALNGIFLSSDDGNSWQAINNGLPSGSILSVEINESKFFAGTPSNGAYLSTDYGANWLAINNGSNAIDVWGFEFSGSNVFLNCSEGVHLSTDDGSNWTSVSDGLSDTWILSLYIKDDFIFAGSGNSGILFRRPLSELISDVGYEEMYPVDFTLFQNYPNPFNPSTKISWHLPEASNVTLQIFNALGEEISTLVNNEYQNAGEHSSLFIVNSSLPSGVYFYQLKAGNYLKTKKMILLR